MLLLAASSVQAQWVANGNNINNTNSGSVGIGTTNPFTKLHVVGDISMPSDSGIRRDGNNLLFAYITAFPGIQMGSGTVTDKFRIHAGGVERLRIETTGFIGIGTNVPNSQIHVRDPNQTTDATNRPPSTTSLYVERANLAGSEASIVVQGSSKGTNGSGRIYLGNADEYDSTSIYGGLGSVIFFARNAGGASAEVARIGPTGNFTVVGNLAAKYQDIAEWVSSTSELSAGTVVILNPERTNEVMASKQAYDTSVAGVVSENPGLILGEAGSGKEKIATSGRVKVRVDARKRPVKIGDLLVTSDRAGFAMVSEPLDVAGFKMHRPGTILGKALEPLPTGEGEVLVLLALQ